jgi:hypothetical protein
MDFAIACLREGKKHFNAGYGGTHVRIFFFEKNKLFSQRPAQMKLFNSL